VSAFVPAVLVWIVVFAAVRLGGSVHERRRIRARVLQHSRGTRREDGEAPAVRRRGVLEPLLAATEAKLGRTRPYVALRARCERAGIERRAAEVLWAAVGIGVVVGLLFSVASGALVLLFVMPLAALVLAFVLPAARGAQRIRKFDDQLPDLLNELAGALRAGHGLTQALDAAAQEADAPAGPELERALAEMRLGRPLEEALEGMGKRLPSAELRYVLDAVSVQRQVGGSLASLFDLVAATVQERHRFRRKTRSLTAAGRLSAWVLMALPFGLALVFSAIDPGYLAPLFDTGLGRLLVVAGLVLMAIGALMLRRLVAVKELAA
jgi:tight adherence protein B